MELKAKNYLYHHIEPVYCSSEKVMVQELMVLLIPKDMVQKVLLTKKDLVNFQKLLADSMYLVLVDSMYLVLVDSMYLVQKKQKATYHHPQINLYHSMEFCC